MKIHFTGTGTSQGVPVIGCHCSTCTSSDPHDKRQRSGICIELDKTFIAVDTGPDFRQQMLTLGSDHLSAILFTHEHNDHVAGLDDVRPFNFIQKEAITAYALSRTANDIRHRFAYIFAEETYPGAPRLEMVEIEPYKPVIIENIEILPLLAMHGKMEVLGFQINGFTYITDANDVPQNTRELIRGSKVLVLNALHHRKHHSHFNLEQALKLSDQLQVENVYFTHMSHQMGTHKEVQAILPEHRFLAYDGLTLIM